MKSSRRQNSRFDDNEYRHETNNLGIELDFLFSFSPQMKIQALVLCLIAD